MRFSTRKSEIAFAEFLKLAGGNRKIVYKALEPNEDGSPAKFEEVINRIVKLRIMSL